MEAGRRRISEVMQAEVATLAAGDRLDLADDIMQLGRVRHLPVLDGTRLVGVVSQRDLLAAGLTRVLEFDASERRSFLRSVEVAEVMTKDLVTLGPEATLREAAGAMLGHRIGCIPVVRADRTLLGLVTETDLLRAALLEEETDVEAGAVNKEKLVTEWKARVEREIDELRRIRDEINVRMHLGKEDAKVRWGELEHAFHRLEAKGRQISQVSREPLEDVRDAARLLIDELREGYRKIRKAL